MKSALMFTAVVPAVFCSCSMKDNGEMYQSYNGVGSGDWLIRAGPLEKCLLGGG